MGESDAGPELHCSEIVVRLLTARRHLDEDGNATAEAFFLRDTEEALSVFRLSVLSPEECNTKLSGVRSQGTLHVGRVRYLCLELGRPINVIADEENGGPGHASIVGLPRRNEDQALAERAAGLLRDQCRRLR